MMRCRRAFSLLLAALVAAACGEPHGAELPPPPETERMEPAVRRQLEEGRQALEELAAEGAAPGRLAEEIGGLARLYHAYDLTAAAAAHYESALRLSPNEFRWQYLLGLVRQTEGQLEAAAESLEAALAERPDDVPALARLAAVRVRQSREAEARDLFERALGLDPGCAFAWRGLGEIDLRQGDARSAARRFREALTLQPAAASLHFLLASALDEIGETEVAARHLERYADVPVELADPLAEEMIAEASGASAWLLRGHTSLKEGRLEEAVRSYRHALSLDPGNVAGRESLAFALADLGDAEGSLAELRRLVAGGRGSARSHFLMGRLLARGGDDVAALGHYRRSVELDPADEGALFNAASTMARLGDFEAAAEGFERLLRLAPRDAEARYRRALVLQELGRMSEATKELERAAADAPGDERIRARLTEARRNAEAG